MKRVIVVSRSLDEKCAAGNNLDTSSRVFEYGVVSALCEKVDLRLIYLGTGGTNQFRAGGVQFYPVRFRSVIGIFLLAKAIHENSGRREDGFNILTTGYYPLEIATIVCCARLFGGKSFSYVYDTHLQATQKMNRVKRAIANAYFSFGFLWLNRLSGLLVLNDAFVHKNRIRVPILKTKIGVARDTMWACDSANARPGSMPGRVFVFAGTMNAENGINLLIDVLNQNRELSFELHFYGDGDCAGKIERQARADARVKYFGRVSNDLLQERLRAADFLLNLRDPACVSTDYSFPSKLMNFMLSGTPVISNKFPGLDDLYDNYLHLVPDFCVSAVSRKIRSLLQADADRSIGAVARRYVESNNRWDRIADEIVDFMSVRS